MNENEKKRYLEKYKKAKEDGVPFFPDILFKDAVIALLVFLILGGLAYFVGAPLESRANPADNSYTPRPEWYFLFLFQLLKYFPGNLEVLGVVIIPGVVIGLLFLLPLLDKHPRRHFINRPWVSGITTVLVFGIVALSILSYLETPPPAETGVGDPVAALYTANCATCHGLSIPVPDSFDLHNIIAQGTHEGMPAWNADLDTDEIDALAGFITSPGGNDLYNQYCLECHQISDLVASNQIELRDSLEQGISYPAHDDIEIPIWSETLSSTEITDLLNFLVAPDGKRLFTINCSSCHGRTVAYAGEEVELQEIIRQGGLHLEMPSWKGSLASEDLDLVANYVLDPAGTPESEDLFIQNCSICHGSKIPQASSFKEAREIIASGGSHEIMPVWGNILTDAQLSALTAYTWQVAQGSFTNDGQNLFAENCASCHGTFGEGGQNPARQDDVIAPISSAEYLSTRDDFTLFSIIAQGQPNFGMSPFSNEFGGPLSDDQIDAIVFFMRNWELDPPVDLPPEVQAVQENKLSGQDIFNSICTQCHYPGEDASGPSLLNQDFQDNITDQGIFDSIKNGHPSSAMIAYGSLFSDQQIQELIKIIRQLVPGTSDSSTTVPDLPSFANDIVPILEADCVVCHGTLGGWDGSSYDTVINSGDNGPAVIRGDTENSLLIQKLRNTQEFGALMPPAGKLADNLIQLFLDWIDGGALDN